MWGMDGANITSANYVGGAVPPAWNIQDGSSDYNGDGKSDILWRNDNGQVYMWGMDGVNIISANYIGGTVPPDWHILG